MCFTLNGAGLAGRICCSCSGPFVAHCPRQLQAAATEEGKLPNPAVLLSLSAVGGRPSVTIEREIPQWAKVIKFANIKPE